MKSIQIYKRIWELHSTTSIAIFKKGFTILIIAEAPNYLLVHKIDN